MRRGEVYLINRLGDCEGRSPGQFNKSNSPRLAGSEKPGFF